MVFPTGDMHCDCNVLPLFDKDNPKQFEYWFSHFFRQKGIVLNFWSEFSKTWWFQKCIACVMKVLRNMYTWCLFDENNANLNKYFSIFAPLCPILTWPLFFKLIFGRDAKDPWKLIIYGWIANFLNFNMVKSDFWLVLIYSI